MTAYRFVTLTCDRCGEICDPGCARTVGEARAVARAEGWIFGHGQDICPAHRGYVRFSGSWHYSPELAGEQITMSDLADAIYEP